jgi:protein-L-isoaspartate(D-aspartate) O-methyltransferase
MRMPWMRSNDQDAPDRRTPSREDQIAALLDELRHDGIRDERVLAAIAAVPRERFVPEHVREYAWANVALPIDAGQTISQPYIVAAMTSALRLRPADRVLEIGTGSGYQAAILAHLAAQVCTIERHAELAEIARATLRDLGITNVDILIGDGTQGWPDAPPFDRMIVTAAGPDLPAPLLDQLNPDGGRLVVPVGPHDGDQRLLLVTSDEGALHRHDLGPVRFVPLIGKEGWRP